MELKRCLYISSGVPVFFGGIPSPDNIDIERIDTLSSGTKKNAVYAYLLDLDFINKHKNKIPNRCAKESVILWNPEGNDASGIVPPEYLFQELGSLSSNSMIKLTIGNVFSLQELKRDHNEQQEIIRKRESITRELLGIGIALSAERDNDTLLDSILQKSREITGADAGSLYLLEEDKETGAKSLLFKIAQNDSNPTDFTEFRMPLNTKSIAGYVAVTGETINIKDAYRIPKRKKVGFNKSYDEATGYRTKSILTVPMKDHKEQIIGVVQLINRKRDFHITLTDKQTVLNEVVSFDDDSEALVRSLASQAAVSLENNRLYEDIELLFEGFVRASSKAIESRDPTTSGHSNRVAAYTVELAKAVDKERAGRFKDITFDDEQIKELRYSGLLHDFGKVGVREQVLVKAQKLYAFQLDLIRIRFGYIMKAIQLEVFRKRFDFMKLHGNERYKKEKEKFDREENGEIAKLKEYMDLIMKANEPKILEEDPAQAIEEIARKTYVDMFGGFQKYLTGDEFEMLSIKKGSLSERERREIESHVIHSYEFLKNIPWTDSMRDIPEIARGHHEKLNGGGYPDGIKGDQISLPTRMMAIADIFDALTAQDRPYKKAVPVPRALGILKAEAENNHLDADLVELFIREKVYETGGE